MAALALDEAILQTLERLALFPHSGRMVIVPATGVVVIGKYIPVYESGVETLQIGHFHHAARLHPPVQNQ